MLQVVSNLKGFQIEATGGALGKHALISHYAVTKSDRLGYSW